MYSSKGDYDPLDNSVAVRMTMDDLESLEVFLDFADAFLKKMNDEKLWPERDKILKMVNEVTAISRQAEEQKERYEAAGR